MANTQLVTYIKQQLENGVAEEAVKSALLGAGWGEGDIREAMENVKQPAPAASPTQVAALPASSIVTSSPQVPAAATAGSPQSGPSPAVAASAREGGPSAALPKSQVPGMQGPPVITADIFQPKDLAVFEPSKPVIGSTAKGAATLEGTAPPSWKRWILPGALGLVALLAIAAAAWFYTKAGDSEAKLAALTAQQATIAAQVDALTKKNTELAAQAALLTEENTDLIANLSAFAAPKAASGTALSETEVRIKGTVSGGDKALFTLTTSRNVTFLINNSRDVKVAGVLKPLVGTQVEIAGTHVAGTREVTVTAVNNVSVQ